MPGRPRGFPVLSRLHLRICRGTCRSVCGSVCGSRPFPPTGVRVGIELYLNNTTAGQLPSHSWAWPRAEVIAPPRSFKDDAASGACLRRRSGWWWERLAADKRWYLQPLPSAGRCSGRSPKRCHQGSSEDVSRPMSRPRSAVPDGRGCMTMYARLWWSALFGGMAAGGMAACRVAAKCRVAAEWQKK